MKDNSESTPDQFGDAAGGPEVGREAVGGRLLGEPLADLLILFGSEEPGSARRGLGGQPRLAFGTVLGHPLGHGDAVDTQGDGHGGL